MDIKKFVIHMVGIVCIIVLSILGICSFFYYLVPIDFPGTVGEWITALSTLSGGALTLGGVWWTINYEKKTREEEKNRLTIEENEKNRKLHMPFLQLSIEPSYNKTFDEIVPQMFKLNFFYTSHPDDNYHTVSNKKHFLKLKNVGNDTALNVNIVFNDIDFHVPNQNGEYKLSIDSSFDEPYIVKDNEEIIPILFHFNHKNLVGANYFDKKMIVRKIDAYGKVSFNDILGHSYQQKIHLGLFVDIRENNIELHAMVSYAFLENITLDETENT